MMEPEWVWKGAFFFQVRRVTVIKFKKLNGFLKCCWDTSLCFVKAEAFPFPPFMFLLIVQGIL